MIRPSSRILFIGLALAVTLASPAAAYVGPGAGLSMLGALWGLVVAVAVAIGFVLLWPFRRLLKTRRAHNRPGREQEPTSSAGPGRS